MATDSTPQPGKEHPPHEDEALPTATDEEVLEETARLAREGRKELEADPNEPKERKPPQ